MPPPKPRAKIFPFPVEVIVNQPLLDVLPVAGAGMFYRLAIHYWITGCRPLPSTDTALSLLVRATRSTWSKYRKDILELFALVKPALDARHLACQHARDGIMAASRAGRIAQLNARRDRLAAEARAAKAADPLTMLQPKRSQANAARETASRTAQPVPPAGWTD